MARRGPLNKLKLKEKNKKKEKGERKRKIKKRKRGERRERGGGGGERAPTSIYDLRRSGDLRLTGNGLKSEYAARTTRGY